MQATTLLSYNADYAIAADFCNFDQNNGSLVHNCIYRLEAEETGANTGIFEGTVEYINMVNSTTGSTAVKAVMPVMVHGVGRCLVMSMVTL